MELKERVGSVIEKSTQASTQFERWFRESWRTVVFMALLFVALSIGFLMYALSGRASKEADTYAFDVPAASSTGPLAERALDGVLVDASSTRLLPFGVMVENNIEAWPLSGPAKANLVFEAPVEGSITRLFLLFDASTAVDRIGPVRSARPYYVELAESIGSLYAHVGGSPASLALISKLADFRDLNEFSNGQFFWRSPGRSAPHNVYTSTDELRKAAEQKSFVVKDFRPWEYVDDIASTQPSEPDVADIVIPYEGAYKASWHYDPETRIYTRSQNDVLQKDEDGSVVTARNVVVLLTAARVLDGEGRLDLRTTGSGEARIFHDGKASKAFWKRRDGQMMTFESVDGLDVPLARGTTWISFLTSPAAFARVTADTRP